MTIRVLLADDQALLRSAFRVLVDSEPDMEVVGEASDGAEAVRLAREQRADVVLMDIRMPGTDGLAATLSSPWVSCCGRRPPTVTPRAWWRWSWRSPP